MPCHTLVIPLSYPFPRKLQVKSPTMTTMTAIPPARIPGFTGPGGPEPGRGHFVTRGGRVVTPEGVFVTLGLVLSLDVTQIVKNHVFYGTMRKSDSDSPPDPRNHLAGGRTVCHDILNPSPSAGLNFQTSAGLNSRPAIFQTMTSAGLKTRPALF